MSIRLRMSSNPHCSAYLDPLPAIYCRIATYEERDDGAFKKSCWSDDGDARLRAVSPARVGFRRKVRWHSGGGLPAREDRAPHLAELSGSDGGLSRGCRSAKDAAREGSRSRWRDRGLGSTRCFTFSAASTARDRKRHPYQVCHLRLHGARWRRYHEA